MYIHVQCSATWQVQGKTHTHNQLSRSLMSTPSINTISPSHHKGFAFSTPKMMPLFKENIGFQGGFPFPSSVSALFGSYDTRAVIGWTILKYPGPNTGKKL